MPHPLAALSPTETTRPSRSSQSAVEEASGVTFTLAIETAQGLEQGEAMQTEAELTDDAAVSLIEVPDTPAIPTPEAIATGTPNIGDPVFEKLAENGTEIGEASPGTLPRPDLNGTPGASEDQVGLPNNARPEPPIGATLTGDAPVAETPRPASPKADTTSQSTTPQSTLSEPTYGKAAANQSFAHPVAEPEQPTTQEAADNEGDQPSPPRIAVTAPQVSSPVPTSPAASGPAAPTADIVFSSDPATPTEEPAIPAPSSRDMPTAPTEAARSVLAVPPRVTEQVVRLLQNADPTTGGNLELRLDPPELGRVRISFSGLEGALTATLSAERPEVEALIRRHADELLRNLAEAGFDGASLNFASHGAKHQKDALGTGLSLEDNVAPENATGQIGSRVLDDGQLDIRL
ncbi:flagellar hook-length control protein FliK [Halovulum sp. GXIMD14793]